MLLVHHTTRMKFQNLVVALCELFFCSNVLAAGLSTQTTVYPSTLFPGKMWAAPAPNAAPAATSESIWHVQETHGVRYRPLDGETAAIPPSRAEYCIPPETEPMPKYRGEQEDMPLYRSELEEDFRSRPRPRRAPSTEDLDLPPSPRYRYNLDIPYPRGLSNVPPVWDWMDDQGFSNLYPPLHPDDWSSPYLRNNFSATEPGANQSLSPIPLKNQHVITSPSLTISADWIPAPSSALVDSDEFKPNYVTRPNSMKLGEAKP
jgi:hypothetical protein